MYVTARGNKMTTFVIVHGGWDGGWAWRGIARELQASGHEVFTATLTGSGERAHLASPDIGLDTHIQDVVNIFKYERLSDVVLVAHSYGGMVATGAAEQVPELIRQLIYLDAFVPQDGQKLNDLSSPMLNAFMDDLATQHGDGWRVPHIWPGEHRTDFLIKCSRQPLAVNNPQAARIPRTYVHFTAKADDDPMKPIFEAIAQRVRAEGYDYHEAPYEHYPALDYPKEIAHLLLELI
jgi:pimeloyl-ACP methyl ester carboxylesterase